MSTEETKANTTEVPESALLCGGMEFDLFKAMAHMEDAFGGNGEILVRRNYSGYIVRLSRYCHDNCVFHHTEFAATFNEITQGVANVMEMKFHMALELLKKQAE